MKTKIVELLAKFGGLTKPLKKAQAAVDGKKATITSLLSALAFTGSIVLGFASAEDPMKYLVALPQSPDFLGATGSWTALFLALKGEKIRHENAEIIDKLDSAATEEKKG